MKVKVRTKDVRFSVVLPIGLIGLAVKLIPGRAFEEISKNVPEPYDSLITKEYVRMISQECVDILRENKGLEMVRVEAADGTFVLVKL